MIGVMVVRLVWGDLVERSVRNEVLVGAGKAVLSLKNDNASVFALLLWGF